MSYNKYTGGYPQYTNFQPPSNQPQPAYGGSGGTQNMQIRRNQQIQSIFMAFPKQAVSRQNDNSVIDVQQSLRNNNRVTFRIMLGTNFPLRPPSIRLMAKCSPYTYIDQNTSNVIHASLQRWDPNCNLGSLCKQIFDQFVNFPPTILQNNVDPSQASTPSNPVPTYGGFGGPAGVNVTPSSLSPQPQPQPHPEVEVKIPNLPSKFREIDSLSKEEVDELLSSKVRLDSFVEKLEYYQDLCARIDSLRTENVNIAKRNKEREYQIKQKTDMLNQMKVEVQNLSNVVNEVNQRRLQIQNQYQPKHIVKSLSKLMIEGEKAFTKNAEKFSEEGGDVRQFIKGMKKDRQLYHIRKLKKEGFEQRYANQM